MDTTEKTRRSGTTLYWSTFCVLLAVAVFFIWTEHRTHLLGALPYLILLLCPLMHLLMHRRHRH